MNAPKVFLSHATEDKARFVNKFAEKLREKGVDAWLDKWEMLPGDSLVDKIFEEGLKDADSIIIVLSTNSVKKPWVREELNSGIVAKLSRGTKLIPVVIDNCEVPEALKSTVWESIEDINNYDDSFNRILASIFVESIRPNLGTAPKYVSTALREIGDLDLDPNDNLILKVSCEHILAESNAGLEPGELFGEDNEYDLAKSEILESVHILGDRGFFSVSGYIGGGPEKWGSSYRVTHYGFEQYCKAYIDNYGCLIDKSAFLIINENKNSSIELSNELNISISLATHIIRLFERNGFVKVGREGGDIINIYEVLPAFRRALALGTGS